MTKRVTFDYDGTLEKPKIREYAKSLVERGIDVWLVTTRWDDAHKHLYIGGADRDVNQCVREDCDYVGIPPEKRIFTNMEWKAETLDRLKPVWHIDDTDEEYRQLVLNQVQVTFISVFGNWHSKCERLLKK